LGNVLFILGKITEETYQNIEKYIEPKKKLGEVLIKNGLISEKDLMDGLSYQMREILLNTFPDFEGEFKFQEKEDFVDKDFEAKIDISLLIEEGIRRMKYDEALREFMERKRPFLKSKSFFFRLTEEEKEMFAAIKGEATAASVLQSSHFHPEAFWKSLYLFYCLGMVDVPDEDRMFDISKKEARTRIGDKEKNIADALAMSESFPKMDYYQVLGVSASSDQEEIKKNYFKLARRYHPDIFERDLPHEIKEIIEEVFDTITKAYHTLRDEQKRKAYDIKKQKITLEDKRDWAKTAEMKFRQAKTLYDKKKYQEAVTLLEEAVRLQGSKGKYFLLLALTQYKIPALLRKSEENFVKAVKFDPWNAEGYIGLGLLYKREGLKIKARKQFEKALRVDPDHKVALRELDDDGKNKKKTLKDILAWEPFGKKK
jgi:curved DNA-binding protein CbpA